MFCLSFSKLLWSVLQDESMAFVLTFYHGHHSLQDTMIRSLWDIIDNIP